MNDCDYGSILNFTDQNPNSDDMDYTNTASKYIFG